MGFIQSATSSSGGNTQDKELLSLNCSKISNDYDFNSSDGIITINDYDFKSLLYARNLTTGSILYNPLDSNYSGVQINKDISLNTDTSNMNDTDNLLLIYQTNNNTNETIQNSLSLVVRELIEIKEVLRDIYR